MTQSQLKGLEALDLLPGAFAAYVCTDAGTIALAHANGRVRRFMGQPEDRALPHDELLDAVHPDDRTMVAEAFVQAATEKQNFDLVFRAIDAKDATVWVRQETKAVEQADGTYAFYASYTDVTDAMTLQRVKDFVLQHHHVYFEDRYDIDDPDALLDVFELQYSVFKSLVETYTTVELTDLTDDTYINVGCLDYVKKLMGDLTSTQAVLNRVVEFLIAPEFQKEAALFHDTSTLPERLRDGKTLSMDYNGSIGGWLRGQIIPVAWGEDGRAERAVFTVQRLHDNKIEIERLKKLSETDGLSQLLNRTAGEQRINRCLDDGIRGMFCIFDVDDFKQINDKYGHAAGDEVIRGIGICLKEAFRKGDILMRTGGDEFALYCLDIQDEETGARKIADLTRRIENLRFESITEQVSISSGIVYVNGRNYRSYDEVFDVADARMYENKRARKARLHD